MKLTIVGGCIIAFAAVAVIFYPRRLFQAIMFFSPFSNTSVVNLSNLGITPPHVLFPAYFVWKFLSGDLLRPVRVSSSYFTVLTPLIGLGLFSVVTLLINYATRVVSSIEATQTLYIVFGVCLTLAMSLDLSRTDRLEAGVTALRFSAIFISLWAIVQIICFYTGIPYPTIFNNSASHSSDMFDQSVGSGVARLASVTNEPSYLAMSLLIFGSFGSTLLATEPRFRVKAWTIPVALSLIIVLASTSSTGLVGLAVLATLLGSRRPGLVAASAIGAILALLFVIWLSPTFGDALYTMTFEKKGSSSYSIRYGSVIEGFRLFEKQPWMGWGWGSHASASLITQFLTSVGVIGSVLFLGAVGVSLHASRKARLTSRRPEDWRIRAYARGAEYAMIVYLLQSVISSFHFVVADFWCLWALTLAIPSSLIPTRGMLAVGPAQPARYYRGLATRDVPL